MPDPDMTDPDASNLDASNPDDVPSDRHRRPPGVDDATVEALGKLSEGLEGIEQARGYLYGFHRLTGEAHAAIGEAIELLRSAGHSSIADALQSDILGRNVLEGRWTFQIVEEYDDGYYSAVKAAEQDARDRLVDGRRHLFEAGMKEVQRTRGRRHHEARPADGS